MLKLTARQEQILNLIKEAIDNTGFPPTRAEIAQELGFRSANAAEEHLQALARKGAIEISPGTSRGIRLVGRPRDAKPAPCRPSRPALLMSLPLVGRVAAGSPILAQEHVEATYSVDPAMFSSKPDFLLKVKGWSMRDAGICDGDFLAVKKVDSAKNGQIVVARIGEEVTVKRYRKTGGTIELLPENPDFSVITVDPHTRRVRAGRPGGRPAALLALSSRSYFFAIWQKNAPPGLRRRGVLLSVLARLTSCLAPL